MISNTAILLTNLGSPNSTSVKDVRRYLNEFLMDKRVIDIPYWKRFLIVKGIITPLRAPRSAKKYKVILTPEGLPLITITQELVQLVGQKTGLPTYMSMRYGEPEAGSVLSTIQKNLPDCKRVVVLPLYPHYAMSSYETAVEHIKKKHAQTRMPYALEFVPPFYREPSYIKALVGSITPFWNSTTYDHLLFSYHGLPERHIKKGDTTASHCLQVEDCCNCHSLAHKQCYRHQVLTTTKHVCESLHLDNTQVSVSFQSRLGRDKWLRPSTEETLSTLPAKGVKKLLVVCPGFTSDCLETLEEIHEEGKETFLNNGGKHYEVIPCLNTDSTWVDCIQILLKPYLSV